MTWIETFSGQKVSFPFPEPESIKIHDIAHGLAHICRFSGQCSRFYSVAQHSLNMAIELNKRGCGPRLLLLGLLHDASEAYIGDMPSPLKRLIPAYREIEKTHSSYLDWPAYTLQLNGKSNQKRTDELLLG